LEEYFSLFVEYDSPTTHYGTHNAIKGPRDSLHILLEVLNHFSLPNPYSVLYLNSFQGQQWGYDSLPTHQPLIRLMIKHSLLNLRPQMSVIMLADPLTHLIFKEEFTCRYGKLSLQEKLRYKLRSPLIISGYSFLKYINNLH
jgi:hypothetical protein